MIHPSYVDLMQVVNKGVEEGETPVINSRYSIVMATAKRARQIVDGDDVLIDAEEGDKPLSIAIEELNQEKIRILAEDEEDEYDTVSESDYPVGQYEEEYSAGAEESEEIFDAEEGEAVTDDADYTGEAPEDDDQMPAEDSGDYAE